MEALMQSEFWLRWLRIVIIDLTLAGDNALVIALAVRSLPAREQLWGRIFGTAGAVILRVGFIVIVTWLLQLKYLQLIGGLLLIGIAIKLIRHEPESGDSVRRGGTLYEAIGIIILADVVMSLDNVIAIAAAARGDFKLVVFGLLLSLPLVVWGSGVLASLMKRLPVIIWLGGGVLGYVAMEMILKDQVVIDWLAAARIGGWPHSMPYVLAVVLTLLGWWFTRGAGNATSAPPVPDER
jgi:YjbE family integral membrane protein